MPNIKKCSRRFSGDNTNLGRSAGVMLLTFVVGGNAFASSPTLGPTTVVSSGSIFSACTADHVAAQPGTNFPGTNIEPNLAINPAHPTNFLITVQQDRWSNGGARGLRGNYSTNGGASFHPTSTPGVTECQGGPWPRSSDPWGTFSPDGTAYISSLVTEELANPNLFGHNGQVVSQSLDGGVTWSNPITLIDTPAQPDATKPQALNDKNSTTADPTDSRYADVVWDKLTSFTPGYGVSDEGGGGNDSGHPGGLSAIVGSSGAKDGLSIARHLRELARHGTPFGLAQPMLGRAVTANGPAP
jgi:hypothetical protein